MKNKKIIIVIFFISLFGFFGCKDKPKAPSGMFARTPKVSYIVVKNQKVELTRELPGRVISYKSAPIIPQVSGVIKKRIFKQGSYVKKGDLLYIIDPSPYEASLDKAKASLKAAESTLPALKKKVKRYRELTKTNSISEQVYEDTLAALNQLKAQIELYKAQIRSAKLQLDYCYIKAPISGIISRTFITEGEVVYAYQPKPLAVIHQFDPVYVDVPRSIIELNELKKLIKEGVLKYNKRLDENILLRLPDDSIYPYKGKLLLKEVSVNESTSYVILRIVYPNKKHELLPGMFVRAIFFEGIRDNGILIPQESVLRDPKGRPFVYVVTPQNTVLPSPIVIDRAIKDKWLINRGLKVGDKVVVYGIQYIRPGVKVVAEPVTKLHNIHK